jgi:nucleotide-binding universal stress UspA family protein
MTGNEHGPVVVGIDGSDEAARAAEYGAWEARRRHVPLRLVFAHRPPQMWGPSLLIPNDYAWVQDWVGDMLATAVKTVTAAHPDVTVETTVVSGGAAAVLVDESRHASLVVLGTRARGGVSGHIGGSVAAQVAAHAHTPVIVLRPDGPADPTPPPGGRILVGLDGSVESERAMAFAVEEAAARDAAVDAVYVWNVLEVRDLGPLVPDGYDIDEAEEKALRLLTEATVGWSDRHPDLVIGRRLVHGLDAADALARESVRADLVVVGSRGHGGFLGLRLGSTVDALIRHAGAPIAVVRAGEPA